MRRKREGSAVCLNLWEVKENVLLCAWTYEKEKRRFCCVLELMRRKREGSAVCLNLWEGNEKVLLCAWTYEKEKRRFCCVLELMRRKREGSAVCLNLREGKEKVLLCAWTYEKEKRRSCCVLERMRRKREGSAVCLNLWEGKEKRGDWRKWNNESLHDQHSSASSRSRDISVSIDSYRLDVRGSLSGRSKIFFSTPQRPDGLWGPCSFLLIGYRGVKRPGREGDHSPPSSAVVKIDGTIPPLPHTSSRCFF
jgi:hypothetical protein